MLAAAGAESYIAADLRLSVVCGVVAEQLCGDGGGVRAEREPQVMSPRRGRGRGAREGLKGERSTLGLMMRPLCCSLASWGCRKKGLAAAPACQRSCHGRHRWCSFGLRQ